MLRDVPTKHPAMHSCHDSVSPFQVLASARTGQDALVGTPPAARLAPPAPPHPQLLQQVLCGPPCPRHTAVRQHVRCSQERDQRQSSPRCTGVCIRVAAGCELGQAGPLLSLLLEAQWWVSCHPLEQLTLWERATTLASKIPQSVRHTTRLLGMTMPARTMQSIEGWFGKVPCTVR